MRTITTCAGIGDSIWILMKLINSGEKFHFNIPNGIPQRGKQIFDLLPQVAESCTYQPALSYKLIDTLNAGAMCMPWNKIAEDKFFLSANRHLEEGNRLEKFLPDLPISYTLDYDTKAADQQVAETLLPQGPTYIGIYTSAYSNARNWNAWGNKEWMRLIRLMNRENICFVIIGAEYDTGITEDLLPNMDVLKIQYVNTIGQPLSVVVEMLKKLSFFIGFPSGLSILNETLEKDGVMFYSEQVKKIINTWANPERIKNGNIKECVFCEPATIYKWIDEEYKLYERI